MAQQHSTTSGKTRRNFTRDLNTVRKSLDRAILDAGFDSASAAAEAILTLVENWNGNRDDLRYRLQLALSGAARDVAGYVESDPHVTGSLDDPTSLRGLLEASRPYVPASYQTADLTPYLLN